MRSLSVLLWVLTFSVPAASATSVAGSSPPAGVHAAAGSLQQVIRQRLKFYNDRFPGIRFVVLPGGDQWLESMNDLYLLLGEHAINLDYDCPPELHKDLLAVCVARIKMMLQASESSSALFGVGVGSLADRPQVCVVTLDAPAVAGSSFRATRHLIPLSDAQVRRIPRAHWLDGRSHLTMVLDHEIFHCLDSRFNRPIPRSYKASWAQYMGFYNENGADAFALAMQLRRQGRITAYVRDFVRVRGIALYGGDVNHYTYGVLCRVLAEDPRRLASMTVRQVFRLASRLRDATVPDYDQYLRYRRLALAAARQLQAAPDAGAAPPAADGPRLTELLRASRACHRALFSTGSATDTCVGR